MEITRIIFGLVIVILFLIIIRGLFFKKEPDSNEKETTEKDPHAVSPAPKKSKMGVVGGIIGLIIGILLLVLVASWTYSSIKSIFAVKEKPVVQTHVVVHEVPMEGTFIYLHPGWKDYPTGEIKITTPNGEILRDEPGIMNHFGYQPEGWYKFVAENKQCRVKTEDVY